MQRAIGHYLPREMAVLGLIVLIRTFLSFSLQVEIDGKLPWRRGAR